MLQAIFIGGLSLIGGALVILGFAYALLAASSLDIVTMRVRVAPALGEATEGGLVTHGAPARWGFLSGLVHALMSARRATRRIRRDTTS